MRRDRVVFPAVAVIALLAAALLLPAGTSDRTLATYPVTARIGPADANVSLGVTVDTDEVAFGTVPATDLRVTRKIEVRNSGPDPARITVEIAGNVTSRVSITPRQLTLEPGVPRNITATFAADTSLRPETVYTGTLRLEER